MPITANSYNTRSGEMLYTISAEEGAEEFKLAVTPKDRNRNQLTFWQGDRYDENNFLVAQSDPIRLEYERAREDFYRIVESVFGPMPWVREALTSIARVHPKRVEEELEAIKKESAEDPEIKALRGHEPTIFRTPEGYRMEAPGGANLIPLSNFTGRIIEDVIVDYGSGEADRFFVVEAVLNGRRHRFEVSSQAFDGLSWVSKHLGALAVFEGPRVRSLVTKAIRLESVEGLKEVHAYGQTGWLELNDRWAYLHAGSPGAITAVGQPPFRGRVRLTGKLARRKFPEIGSEDDLRSAVSESLSLWLLSDYQIAIPLFGSVYRAALGEVDYSVHLGGKTGLGKTSLAQLAVSHFTGTLTSRDQTNFESTPYSIEAEAFGLKDQALLVDDFLGTAKHRQILAYVARNAANLSGRGRLSSGGELIGDKPPRALVITTGEDLPVGQSLVARILVLSMSDNDGLTFGPQAPINDAQDAARSHVFARAMAGFIRWLAPRYGEIQATLEERRNRYGYEIAHQVAHTRTPAIYGNVRLGIEEYLNFAHEIGAVSERERDSLEELARVATLASIQGQAEHLAHSDPVDRYQALLAAAIGAGKAHLRAPEEEPAGRGLAGTHLGWRLEDGVYLYSDVALTLAKEMAASSGAPLTLSARALNTSMNTRGLLVSTSLDKGRGFAVRKRIEGRTHSLLHLPKDFV